MADDTSTNRSNLFATVFHHSNSQPPSSTYSDGTARTIYRSKNNTTGAEFSCTAPPGSKHAQAMRELCASVQGVSLPQQPQPQSQSRYQRHLPTATRAMLTESQHQAQTQDHPYPQGEGYAQHSNLIRTVSKASGYSTKSKHRNPNPPKLQYRNGNPNAAGEGATVFRRIEDDRSVTYLSKSAHGEVFVAAPKGSEEAEEHERMARGMAGEGREEVKLVSRPRLMLRWLGS